MATCIPISCLTNATPSNGPKLSRWWQKSSSLPLELGGTLSGEHGVGALKRPYMQQALGPVSIEIQKRIKQALDPLNILNPGKVFPMIA